MAEVDSKLLSYI